MKIIITGAEADIREMLGPKLLERMYRRAGLDAGLNRYGWLFKVQRTRSMIPMPARQPSNPGLRRSKRAEPSCKSVVRAPKPFRAAGGER